MRRIIDAPTIVRLGTAGAALIVGIALLACQRDTIAAPAPAGNAQLWEVSVNAEAITMSTVAPYDTLRLVATPLGATRTPMTSPVDITYATDDPSISVDTNGLLTAHTATPLAHVIVTASDAYTVRADTISVVVDTVSAPPKLAALSLSLPPGVSPTVAVNASLLYPLPELIATLTDQSGHVIETPLVAFSSSDTLIAIVQNGAVGPIGIGSATLYASATLYGVTRRDSLRITVTQSIIGGINILTRTPVDTRTPEYYFDPATLRLAPGVDLVWVNQTNEPVDVVFDDPTAVLAPDQAWLDFFGAPPTAGGNIPTIGAVSEYPNFGLRKISRPGTYHYHSQLHPEATGTLIIQ